MEKQRDLREAIDLLKSEDPYLTQNRDIGNADPMDEAMDEDMVKENIDIRMTDMEKSIDQIEKALGKIEEGTYGICEETGEPIDMARLEAYPEATTAVDA